MPHIYTHSGPFLKDQLTGTRRFVIIEDRDTDDRDLDVNDMAMINTVDEPSCPGATAYTTGVIKAPVEMTSSVESPNHEPEIDGTAGPGGTTYMTGFGFPADNFVGNPYPALIV